MNRDDIKEGQIYEGEVTNGVSLRRVSKVVPGILSGRIVVYWHAINRIPGSAYVGQARLENFAKWATRVVSEDEAVAAKAASHVSVEKKLETVLKLVNSRADLEAKLAEAEAERDRLREIIEGREVAPTDAEIEAHAAVEGSWLALRITDGAVDRWEVYHRAFARWARWARDGFCPPARWWPLSADGQPCAWPKVTT